MRILYVVNDFLPRSKAGTEYYVSELGASLSDAGMDIRVLIPAPSNTNLPPGTVSRRQWNDLPIDEIVLQGTKNEQQQALADYVADVAPDIVHLHSIIGFPPDIVDILGNGVRPVVAHLHDFHFLCNNHILINNNGTVCDGPESIEKCAACHAMSNGRQAPAHQDMVYMENRFHQMMEAFEKLDLALFPSSFSLETFERWGYQNPNHIVRELGLAPFGKPIMRTTRADRIVVACLGGICWFKGQDLGVAAFTSLKPNNATLELYGSVKSPPYFDYIMRTAASVDSISYHGSYGRDDIPRILEQADIVLIPSRMETFSFVLREALQAGKPIIVSDAGALREAVHGSDHGLVFRNGDPADLGIKLKRLFDNPGLIKTMADRVPRPFTIKEDAKGMAKIYAALIK